MNRKIDKFAGRLDFAKDSNAVISKTLNELQSYLNAYGEDDAAEIIKNFADSKTTQKVGHKERVQQEQFLEAYKQRNTILDTIRKRLAKIHDDMHDEQDTTIKDRSKPKPKLEKLKVIQDKLVQAPKSLMDMLKDPLEWVKSLLLGPLLRLLGGKLLGILGAVGGALATLVMGWFAAGKWGFKLIAKLSLKLLKEALKAALKAGGWAFNQIKKALNNLWNKTIKPKLKDIWKDFKNKFDDMLKKGWEYFKEGAKKGWETVKNGAKSAWDTGKDLAKKGWEKITNFFDGVTKNVKNTVTNTWDKAARVANKVTDTAKAVGSTVKGTAVAAKDKVSKAAKAQWDKLKSKVKSIADKIIGYFSKKGKGKAGSILAKRMPKALGKFMSKFIPGIGMALLAYDVYAAAKKSKSAVSFAVNLIDGVSGGLISMGLASALDDFDGENLGSYVDGVLKNVGLGLSGDELDIMKGLDMKGLEAQSSEVLNKIKKITDVGMDGSKNNIEKLEKSLAGNPQKQAIVNEYKRLATLKSAGKITSGQASTMFKNFVDKTLKDTASAVKTLVDPASGVERTTNGTSVETVKNSTINAAAHDAQLAMQARTALTTMAGATDLAYKTALTAATGVAGRVMSTVGALNIFGGNSAPPSVIVQG